MKSKDEFEYIVKKYCIYIILLYFLLSFFLYLIAGEQLKYENVYFKNTTPVQIVGEVVKDMQIQQTFMSQTEEIYKLSLFVANYGNRQNSGTLIVQIKDIVSNRILTKKVFSLDNIKDNSYLEILQGQVLKDIKDKELALIVYSETGEPGNAVTIWKNDTEETLNGKLSINGAEIPGGLCLAVSGRNIIFFGQHYLIFAGSFGILICLYCLYLYRLMKNNKNSLGLRAISAFVKYRFLLSQLVSRDFKTKYKRSFLGILWSFLNPLLTMFVQYLVFSTLFKTDIENFPVYLLTGIVIFSFFSEASSMSLMSIVGNANLITKVYVPKYIYPVSRILSSTINMLLSLIPLFIVVLLTGTRITPSFLLLPFGIICTVVFCIGLGFVLSSIMVFFRDTQFLWGVIVMLWMYLTPIFYPESIIPEEFMGLYKLNPLYHFIRFNRIVIIQGVSPEPRAYFFCLIFAIGMLIIGCLVFKKTQDKFILNI